jgi:polyhydroxybutyrate depolymerase
MVLAYWVDFNNCATTPQITAVPNTNLTDGCTAVHSIYSAGNNGVDVEHYKIIGGGHTWPGSAFTIGVTNNDFSASKKIWEFFMQYDINGKIGTNGVSELIAEEISISPNPVIDKLIIQGFSQSVTAENCRVYSVDGKRFDIHFLENNILDASNLENGIYFLHIETKEESATVQFIKG